MNVNGSASLRAVGCVRMVGVRMVGSQRMIGSVGMAGVGKANQEWELIRLLSMLLLAYMLC